MKKNIIIISMLLITFLLIIQIDHIKEVYIVSPSGIKEALIDVEIIPYDDVDDTEKSDYVISVDYMFIKDREYPLFIDVSKEILYFEESVNNYFTFSNIEINEILSLDVFKSIYKYSEIPEINISVDNTSVKPSLNKMEWFYKKLNNEYSSVTSTVISNNNEPLLNLEKDSKINFEFSVLPIEMHVSNSLGTSYSTKNYEIDIENIEKEVAYNVTFIWDDELYNGEAIFQFDVLVDLPATVEMYEENIYPGDFMTLYIENLNEDEEIQFNQPFVNKVDIWKYGDKSIAIIPISYWIEKGHYEINWKTDINDIENSILVEIKDKEFDTQYLYIDETIEESTRNEAAYEEYDLYMIPARSDSVSKPLFEGLFVQPVEGRISTEFGMYRYVNESLTSYRHSGIDIATAKGTPIQAANNGIVNLARFLTLTGNTVVIDHGMGIMSIYLHMDSLNVEQGEFVKKGDIIGEVGTTGFSTGPHLHWTMSYHTTNLDPYLFMEKPIIK